MNTSLPATASASIEILHPGFGGRAVNTALFDFDGTLSLIRAGWVDVMVPMMVDILAALGAAEPRQELQAVVREFVDRLTGKQTIYQMIELARQIELRGGTPQDPLVYKHQYLDLLQERIAGRLDALRSGSASPDEYLVPGSRALLDDLRSRGVAMYLASGTDHHLVCEEARLLQVDHYFDGRIYGALDDYKQFSKRKLIARMLSDGAVEGRRLIGFGDGYVEIENVKEVGGVAIGVATDEPDCLVVDQWKRDRLAGAGADIIIANFECRPELFSQLFAS